MPPARPRAPPPTGSAFRHAIDRAHGPEHRLAPRTHAARLALRRTARPPRPARAAPATGRRALRRPRAPAAPRPARPPSVRPGSGRPRYGRLPAASRRRGCPARRGAKPAPWPRPTARPQHPPQPATASCSGTISRHDTPFDKLLADGTVRHHGMSPAPTRMLGRGSRFDLTAINRAARETPHSVHHVADLVRPGAASSGAAGPGGLARRVRPAMAPGRVSS